MISKKEIKPCYPGFTRRALSFTIDDGNIPMDERLLSILRPHGIIGTFNLCSHNMTREAEFYRELYRGYGIANHTYAHPYALDDSITYEIMDEERGDQPPSEIRIYPTARDGFYMKHYKHGWRELADTPKYIECIERCRARLVEIFGEGSVRGFVWPYGEQNNAEIKAYLAHSGFSSVRKTGETRDTTGFAVPADRMAWSYNANDRTLLEVMELYENYPDDGTLKFFAFGVHSVDFERFGTWGDLETFAEKYGNRPNDYWYAPVDDIFAYADACAMLTVDEAEGAVTNPSKHTLYIEYNREFYTLPSGATVKL